MNLFDVTCIALAVAQALIVLAIVLAPRRSRRSRIAPTVLHARVLPFHDPRRRPQFNPTPRRRAR